MSEWLKEKILSIEKKKNNLFILKIKNNINFKNAGQYIKIAIKENNNFIYRLYSIISSIKNKYLKFYIYKVNNGYFSNILFNLKNGNYIYVSKKSYGNFIIKNISPKKYLFMLGANTAIGPFLSILNSDFKFINKNFDKIFLLYIVKYNNSFNFIEKIFKLKEKYYLNKLIFVSLVSREKNNLNNKLNFSCKIIDFFLNKKLEKKLKIKINSKNSNFMLCGNIYMINNISYVLNKIYGIKKKNIYTERYF